MVFEGTTAAYKRLKYIIRAEFYQFLTSLLMRSVITIQQRSENGYGF